MPAKGYKSDRTKRLLQLLSEGKTNDDIIKIIPSDTSYLSLLRKKYGFPFPHHLLKSASTPSNRYDWAKIQAFYDLGGSYRECEKEFGVCNAAMAKAVKRGQLKTRSHGESLSMRIRLGKTQPHSPSAEHRQILSESARRNQLGGDRQSKKHEYGGFKLCSSYELRVAQLLDKVRIKWLKPKTRFEWMDAAGKPHTYHPDLYLPELNIYLDPKNSYCIVRDEDKIRRVIAQNGVKVMIVPIDVIKRWEGDVQYITTDLHAFLVHVVEPGLCNPEQPIQTR